MKKITKYINPKIIGVTGGIGSGQSTVCRYLKDMGCKIIDVDKKAKQIINKDQSLKADLKKAFGSEIFDKNGKLDRRLLASIAFRDEEKTRQLNRLVHPKMVAEVIEEMENARFSQKYPIIVIDAALIYEISIEQMFDYIITVYAPLQTRLARVMARDKQTRNEVMARVRRQISLDEKRKWADFVIDNNDSLENLQRQTEVIFNKIVGQVKTTRAIRV